MRTVGKTLQIVGLTLPPLAIVAQLSASISTGQMLTFLVAAVSAFWLGRIMEGFSQPR